MAPQAGQPPALVSTPPAHPVPPPIAATNPPQPAGIGHMPSGPGVDESGDAVPAAQAPQDLTGLRLSRAARSIAARGRPGPTPHMLRPAGPPIPGRAARPLRRLRVVSRAGPARPEPDPAAVTAPPCPRGLPARAIRRTDAADRPRAAGTDDTPRRHYHNGRHSPIDPTRINVIASLHLGKANALCIYLTRSGRRKVNPSISSTFEARQDRERSPATGPVHRDT